MLNSIINFFLERKTWLKAGKPYRNKEKIEELFRICSSNECDNYIKKDDREGKCNICGCRLTSSKEFINKLAWATTKCPFEPSKWGPEKGFENVELDSKEIAEATTEEKDAQERENAPAPKQKGCGCGG